MRYKNKCCNISRQMLLNEAYWAKELDYASDSIYANVIIGNEDVWQRGLYYCWDEEIAMLRGDVR